MSDVPYRSPLSISRIDVGSYLVTLRAGGAAVQRVRHAGDVAAGRRRQLGYLPVLLLAQGRAAEVDSINTRV